jgi:acetyl esterase
MYLTKGLVKWLVYGSTPREVTIEDTTVHEGDTIIPIRIYRPSKIQELNLPLCIFYHGGGYVLGSVALYDPFCRKISQDLHCIIISVEYRCAPEFPFPTAIEDSYSATRWVANHLQQFQANPQKFYVMGDSAGGGIAAVVAFRNRDRQDFQLSGQILFYPWVDANNSQPSFTLFREGYGLTQDLMEIFTECYVPDPNSRENPEVSPLKAKSFEGLPATVLITESHDVLRDQGNQYAQKLHSSGVPLMYKNYYPTIHGFLSIHGILPNGKAMYRDVISTIKNFFAI